jgi:MYXO-CTERM domain-containing protein
VACRRSVLSGLFLLVAAIMLPAPARADGAFPDSEQVLLPALRPSEIVLSTNFGLIFTGDAAASWEWTCETPLTANGRMYQLGIAPPAGGVTAARIVASSLWGAVYSDDGACRWGDATGDVAQVTVTDVFVDRADPRRVFALGSDDGSSGGTPGEAAYASIDGGASFAPAMFRAPPGGRLWGVENAASDPATIYIALESSADQPSLARSSDGGAHWDIIDLGPALGPSRAGIIAVDPTAPATIYLRVSTASDDRVAISRDGGARWTTPIVLPGALSAFLRRSDGTLLVAGITGDGHAWGARSRDGGATFDDWPSAPHALPHVRGLAERDGLLYAAADSVADGYALGISSDGGDTWRPILTYGQVTRMRPCVADTCRNECRARAAQGLWPAAICDAPPAPALDAGGASAGDAPSSAAAGGGCACRAVPGSGAPFAWVLVALAGLAARRR